MFELQKLGGHAKSSVISTVSLAAVFFVIICALSFISNLSLCSSVYRVKGIEEVLLTPNSQLQLKSGYKVKPLLSVKEEVHHHEVRTDGQSGERLLELEMLNSDRLAPQFEHRAGEFFNGTCKFQFFMTWISPVWSFGRRESLALESLFKAHPHGCLMILSRTMDSRRGKSILKPLIQRGFRVLALTPNLPFLFENTPAETWLDGIKSGKKDPGEIPFAQNLSNLLRLAVLYKYGGIYMDTDFIILKEFSHLRNSIVAQSIDQSGNWTRLNNAVLIFDKNHPLLYKFIEEFALTFDGNKWGHNGPYLVSRVVEREMRKRRQPKGYSLTVLPPMAFYPVDWTRVGRFFARPQNQAGSKWVEAKLLQLSGETYGVHLWNRESSKLRIEEGSIIERLISRHCVICSNSNSLEREFKVSAPITQPVLVI